MASFFASSPVSLSLSVYKCSCQISANTCHYVCLHVVYECLKHVCLTLSRIFLLLMCCVLCHMGQCHHRNSHLSCLKCHVSSVCLQFLRKYVKCLQSFVDCGSVSSLSWLTYFSLRMSLHYYSVFCHSVLVKVLVIFVILMNKLHWLSYHCQVQVLIVMFVSYSVTMLSSHDV